MPLPGLTSRERVQSILNGRSPDRVPFNFWMDRDQMARYDKELGADFRVTHYGADVVEAFVCLPWWSSLERKTVDDGKTSWQIAPLVNSLGDALSLPFPDPADPAVYGDIRDKRVRYPDKAIFALMLAPLDVLLPLRLAEGLFTDLYDARNQLLCLLERIRPVLMQAALRACSLDIDVLYLAGDICDRNGPLISPRHLREFLFDWLVDVIAIAHAAGKKVFYHTDGQVSALYDLFIEYGFDGINPVEPRYHDLREFARHTRDRLVLYGGLDNCQIIPNGSVADVRRHVHDQFQILGRRNRLIFSSHDIPGTCPRENLDALVAAIKECTARTR